MRQRIEANTVAWCARARRRALLAALALVCCCGSADAVRRYDSRDGLLQNSINALARDDLGVLWLGSDSGLNRFDGRRFQLPPPALAPYFEGVAISALRSDGDVLWVGTRRDGLLRVDLRQERVLRLRVGEGGFPRAAVTAFALDRDGVLWCATDGGGVVRVVVDADARQLRARQFTPANSALPHARAWSIASVDGEVYAGTETGLAHLPRGSDRFEPLQLPAPFPSADAANIEELAIDDDGSLWIGTWDHGLFRMRGERVQQITRSDGESGTRVSALALTESGPLVGFDTGVARHDRGCDCLQAVPLSTNLDGVSQRAFVLALAPLPDGGFHAATWYHGVFEVPANSAVFRRLLPIQAAQGSFTSEHVQAVLEDRSGHLWLGSYGAGLQRSTTPIGSGAVQLEAVAIPDNHGAGSNAIWRIHEDRRGRIWVGSDSGLDRLDREHGSWDHFRYDRDRPSLPGPGVRDLIERDLDVLVATSSGLARIDADDRVEIIDIAKDSANPALARTINAGARDRSGRIWLATYDGLYLLDEALHPVAAADAPQLPAAPMHDLLLQDDGMLWVAGPALCRIDTGARPLRSRAPTCFGPEAGLPADSVRSLALGSDGALWLGTLQGLHRFDPGSGAVQAFYASSGLVGDEFSRHAASAGASGSLYFGSPAGLQVFDPRALRAEQHPPQPLLTEVRIGQRSLSPALADAPALLDAAASYARSLTLPAGQRQIALSFGLIGARREQDHVEFRIDPLSDWQAAPGDGSPSHVQLPSGDFELWVRASDGAAPAHAEQRLLAIHVQPWWWERRILQAGIAALLLLALYVAYRSRLLVLRQRERRLSELVGVRTREIELQKAELAEANRQLYELSIRDALTGVFNRRHALEMMRRRLDHEQERPLCLALIDLDHFKEINDRYGHIAGDEALRGFARTLRGTAQPGDLHGRYGGEEFLCLLPDRNLEQGRHWAESMLATVRGAPVRHDGNDIRLTASVGLIAIDPHSELSLEAWIARADAALYRAKAEGRDRVVAG